MLDRIRRAIVLDSRLYRMVAIDPRFTTEAAIIAVVASILGGIGLLGPARSSGSFVAELFNGIFLGWIAWAALATVIANGFGGRTTFGQMLRALGFANAPRFFSVLGAIPFIGWILQFGAGILAILAGIVAIREAAGFDTGRAVITALLGLVFYIVSGILIGLLLAGGSLLFR